MTPITIALAALAVWLWTRRRPDTDIDQLRQTVERRRAAEDALRRAHTSVTDDRDRL